MGTETPRWIDAPEFNWNPETPFRVEPQFTAGPEAFRQPEAFVKTAANDDAAPVAPPKRSGTIAKDAAQRAGKAGLLLAAGFVAFGKRIWDAAFQHGGRLLSQLARYLAAQTAKLPAWSTVRAHFKFSLPPRLATARKAPSFAGLRKTALRTPRYFRTRLLIGLAQGLSLSLLTAFVHDNAVSAALGLALLFAPLLLLAGLGRAPGKLLLPWTLIAAAGLLALGFYQRLTGETGVVPLAMTALLMFIGQAMILAWAKSGAPLATYPAYHDSAWTLAIQSLLCALAAAMAFVLAGACAALLRQHDPATYPAFLILPVVTVAVALTSGLATLPLLRQLQKILQQFLTFALLPMLLLSTAAGAAGLALGWQPPLLLCLALGFALLLCCNASYRAGARRPGWQESLEFAAAFALALPAMLGAFALAARVSQAGWTSARILAAAGLSLLAGYTAFYIASALIALGGGAWMKRIERANLVLAIVALALLAALLSPLADPARLAVAGQLQRLRSGAVTAEAFDFAWLRSGGGYFGQRALEEMMGNRTSPAEARGAFLALAAQPDPLRPAPTEIGANIEVRTGNGRLPSALLARDWRQVKTPGVPPCLTATALRCDAYFVDMDGDGRDEILLVYGKSASWWAGVMKQDAQGNWNLAGTMAAPPCNGSFEALRAGHFATAQPLSGWRDLLVGGTRLSVATSERKAAPCPAP